MLQLCANLQVQEAIIEAFFNYEGRNRSVSALISEAKKNGRCRSMRGRYGVKSVILKQDGGIILAPYTIQTYRNCTKCEYAVTGDGTHIKKSMIEEIYTETGKKRPKDYHDQIMEAKNEGRYINLAGQKKAKVHIFMMSGRIYGAAGIREMP